MLFLWTNEWNVSLQYFDIKITSIVCFVFYLRNRFHCDGFRESPIQYVRQSSYLPTQQGVSVFATPVLIARKKVRDWHLILGLHVFHLIKYQIIFFRIGLNFFRKPCLLIAKLKIPIHLTSLKVNITQAVTKIGTHFRTCQMSPLTMSPHSLRHCSNSRDIRKPNKRNENSNSIFKVE